METIKGLARRATQTVRGGSTATEVTQQDEKINEVTRKVHAFEKLGVGMSEKAQRVSRLMNDLAVAVKELSDEFKNAPDLYPEMSTLANQAAAVSGAMVAKAQEFQGVLREQAFDPIGAFLRELPKLKEAEDDRKKKLLEYEFFRNKVNELRRSPPKDTSRIPRNEGILENWRQELWKSTEALKFTLSTLFIQGQRSLDQSALTICMTVCNFAGFTASQGKQHFVNPRLPIYSTVPALQPVPLPPNPLVPFYSPGGPGGVPAGGQQPPPPPPFGAGGGYSGAPQQQQQQSVPSFGYQSPPGSFHQQQPQQQQQPSWGQSSPQQQQQSYQGYPPTSNSQSPPQQQQQQPQQSYPQQPVAPVAAAAGGGGGYPSQDYQNYPQQQQQQPQQQPSWGQSSPPQQQQQQQQQQSYPQQPVAPVAAAAGGGGGYPSQDYQNYPQQQSQPIAPQEPQAPPPGPSSEEGHTP